MAAIKRHLSEKLSATITKLLPIHTRAQEKLISLLHNEYHEFHVTFLEQSKCETQVLPEVPGLTEEYVGHSLNSEKYCNYKKFPMK